MDQQKRFNIVQVVQSFNLGGGMETVAFELAQAFGRAGYANKVLTSSADSEICPGAEIELITSPFAHWVTRGPLRHIGGFLSVPMFTFAATRALKKYKSAPVISHGDTLAGDILVVHAVNEESLRAKRKDGHWGWLLNPIHYWIDLRDRLMIGGLRYKFYVAVSPRVKAELQDHYRVPSERIRVIYNGIDFNRFKASPEIGKKIRDQLGVPAHAKLLLFVGHEFERKGLIHVVEALKLLPQDYWLVVVGSDSPTKYQKLAGAAEQRMIFCGARRDVADFYAAADAFVFPSAYETFALVCMEAMAAGVPVFATRVGGVEDYLKDGVNGYAVTADGGDIAAKIENVFANADLLEQLRQGARATSLGFGWDAVAAQYIALLTEIVGALPLL